MFWNPICFMINCSTDITVMVLNPYIPAVLHKCETLEESLLWFSGTGGAKKVSCGWLRGQWNFN